MKKKITLAELFSGIAEKRLPVIVIFIRTVPVIIFVPGTEAAGFDTKEWKK